MSSTERASTPKKSAANPTADQQPSTTAFQNGLTRRWRLIALVLGLIAAAAAITVPFLPVVQETSKIVWPDQRDTQSVNAPLVAYWAQDLQAEIPCSAIRSLDARTPNSSVLFSTVPKQRAGFGSGLQLRMDNGVLDVVNRGQQVVQQPLGAACDLTVSSNAERTTITVGDEAVYDETGDQRARVIGIYSDFDSARDPVDGLSVEITPDTRYLSTPTIWKTLVTIVGVVALLGCLFATWRMDSRVARRAPRWAPVGWWKITLRDVAVVLTLGLWIFIGPVTADDGYILTMARVRDEIGYLTNYYRWLGVPESPIGWNDHLHELMANISTSPVWIRLPTFLLGVLTWFLLSREILPRLGTRIRRSRAAAWAAAMVFLVTWMPFNTGTRPEPWLAVGVLLALAAVERTLVTRRLLPLCLGLIVAAFSIGTAPGGIVALAPFIVAARPLARMLTSHAKAHGWFATLAPILGSGLAILMVVFADQTMAGVLEATRLRSQVGPNQSWYQELSRYTLLFSDTADGALSRRFPVLLMWLCIITCFVVLLRRGRIPGAPLGPSRRLIGTVALFFVLYALTPTKWTHHFGPLAGIGAALAALTALSVSAGVLRSRRNRMAFLAVLLVIAALSVTGRNAYWFVSRFGVPWNDIPPSIGGISFSSVLLACAGVAALIAFVENIRDRKGHQLAPEKPKRALVFGSLGLVVVCGLFVAGEIGSMLKAVHKQRSSYSFGGANFASLANSGSCNLSDYVMVEGDPSANVLAPLPAPRQRTAPHEQGSPSNFAANGPVPVVGFQTEPESYDDPIGKPPNDFKRGETKMWSSYRNGDRPTGHVRTDWYALPEDAQEQEIAVSVAAERNKAVSITAQFGRQTPQGVEVLGEQEVTVAQSQSAPWADSRFRIEDEDVNKPAQVETMRLIVEDDDLTEDGWIAFTEPRIPVNTTLTERLGDKPTFVDWPASFVHPCVQPPVWRDGIAEVPDYRVTAAPLVNDGGVSSSKGGGPVGWIEEVANQPEVPSFIRSEPNMPWGQLFKVEPYVAGAEPRVIRGEEVRSGWWSPGPGPGPEMIDGETPTR
ncbi:arabinosyltransferase domain-containing protein [Tamaricihabitans halophyticus]|uniref:arabinosyltransferase domain-containing protein n=1 Tax=Tamaricihabitans halophyticus TaxID=1262583 RepID=UPI001FB28E29|nr:arabinosyltransferase domain-containing protein [Tamaricihabitans halophyticus]